MAAIAAALAGGSGPSILRGEVAPMRALLSQLLPKGGPEMVRVEDRDVGGVPVRVYTPQEAARGPIILFHGGGWTVGDREGTRLDSSHSFASRIPSSS